jgi:hypothetical protein
MGLFEEIPDDPELAFLHLEQIFRDECTRAVNAADERTLPVEDYLRYMSCTLAARTELGLDTLQNWNVPRATDFVIEYYQNFRSDVDHFRTILEIRHSRRNKGLTVRFDATAKAKLRHHLGQIREFVDKLELDDWKRDDFYRAISALESEIDRERSRLGVVGDFMVKAAAILGEAAEKAEPARKWVDSIARLIWGAEIQERTKALPNAEGRREIPAPPRQIPAPKSARNSARPKVPDDEIPF